MYIIRLVFVFLFLSIFQMLGTAQQYNNEYNNEYNTAIIDAKADLDIQQYVSVLRQLDKARSFISPRKTTPEIEFLSTKTNIGLKDFVKARKSIQLYFDLAKEEDKNYKDMLLIVSKIDNLEKVAKNEETNIADKIADALSNEEEAWLSAKKINTAEAYEAFLARYPNSAHRKDINNTPSSTNIGVDKPNERIRFIDNAVPSKDPENKWYNFDRFPKHAIYASYFIFPYESAQGWHLNFDIRKKSLIVTTGVGVYTNKIYRGYYNDGYEKYINPSFSFDLNFAIGHGKFCFNPGVGALLQGETIVLSEDRNDRLQHSEITTGTLFKIRPKLSLLMRFQPYTTGVFFNIGLGGSLFDINSYNSIEYDNGRGLVSVYDPINSHNYSEFMLFFKLSLGYSF